MGVLGLIWTMTMFELSDVSGSHVYLLGSGALNGSTYLSLDICIRVIAHSSFAYACAFVCFHCKVCSEAC